MVWKISLHNRKQIKNNNQNDMLLEERHNVPLTLMYFSICRALPQNQTLYQECLLITYYYHFLQSSIFNVQEIIQLLNWSWKHRKNM